MKVIPSNFAASYGEDRKAGIERGAALTMAVVGQDLRRLFAATAEAPLPPALAELAARLDETGPGRRG